MTTEVSFGERTDISDPGLDGKKWRYLVRWRRIDDGLEQAADRAIEIDAVITGTLAATLNLPDADLERVVFQLVWDGVRERLLADDPPSLIDITLSSSVSDDARRIAPGAVPPPGERNYSFEYP